MLAATIDLWYQRIHFLESDLQGIKGNVGEQAVNLAR